MSRRNKIIIGVLVALLLIGIAVFLYFYFFRTPAAPAPTAGDFPTSEIVTTPPEVVPPTVLPAGGKGPRLVKLADGPVAGAVPGKSKGELVVRYPESATGNVYEVTVKTLEKKRLTITTIPRVTEAVWNRAGSAVIARYLKEDNETIESFAASIRPGAGGTEGELIGSFLPKDIESVSVSPSGTNLAYLRREGNRATLITAPFSGSPKTEVFRSPILEWTPIWFAENTVALLSKPSALADGVLLFVNRTTGATETVLQGIRGLTALPSPSGERILVSESADSAWNTRVMLKKTGAEIPISPSTLPEKCVWERDEKTLICGAPAAPASAGYPDAWYQGAVSFADDLWEIDAATGIAHFLLAPKDALDVTTPILNADETHLIFINKRDGSLWAFRLEE